MILMGEKIVLYELHDEGMRTPILTINIEFANFIKIVSVKEDEETKTPRSIFIGFMLKRLTKTYYFNFFNQT